MSTTRTCDHCHGPIHWAARSDARYCSTRCRVAAHRTRHTVATCIPAALTTLPRWVRHDCKRPITITGKSASSTNAQTWATYAAAAASNVGDGLGFALNGDGVVCVDLDHCLDSGATLPSLPEDTYIEVSPSGTGLHVWGLADLAASRVRKGVEVYGTGRYITVTGHRYGTAPSTLANIEGFIASLDS